MIAESSSHLVLTHEAGFESFLTAVFEATRLRLSPYRIVTSDRYIAEFFDQIHPIQSDSHKAYRVWQGLVQKGGFDIASMFRGAFLSELPDVPMALWHFQRKLFSDPTGQFAHNVLDEHAHVIRTSAQKVSHEAHLLTGFVRFSPGPENTYVAAVEPSYDSLELLAPHFMRRFPNMNWLIADTRRQKAIHYKEGELHQLPLQLDPKVLATPDNFPDLWREYYKSITIEQRRNPKLMARLLPRKYWKNLTERA